MIKGRALHFVFKIGDRAKNAFFFRDILGMKVLRHEEFKEGCDAQCNGPYDNRWSKTMVGYGPEHDHFVIELTYNYGVTSYEIGNEFGGITIRSKEVIERAKKNNYEISVENNLSVLQSPDGYRFFVLNEPQPSDRDPVVKTTLHSTNLEKTLHFWRDTLNMLPVPNAANVLTYSEAFELEFRQLDVPIHRANAYGRIAFAVPHDVQEVIDERIKASNNTILTPLISLDTPGKATVRVIILADPDDHEICFVDEEGFSQLSAVDPNSDADLDKNIKRDPFQK